MKRLLIIATFCTIFFCSHSQEVLVKAKVDVRVELVSVVCRLAGYPEYNPSSAGGAKQGILEYEKRVDDYFAPHKSDSLILFAQRLRKEYDLAYDAPMKFAISLQTLDSGFGFNPYFTQTLADLDNRWTDQTAQEYLRLLNSFYKKTDFNTFFQQQAVFYSQMESGYEGGAMPINIHWFTNFFGQSTNYEYHTILSGLNQGGSYGPSVITNEGSKVLFSIISPSIFDDNFAIAESDAEYLLSLAVHEFCHTYANPFIDLCWNGIERNSNKMFRQVSKMMKRSAYGSSKIMMYEVLVRTFVFKYMNDNGIYSNSNLHRAILDQQRAGFFWVDKIYASIKDYESFNTESYLPVFAEVVNSQNPKDYRAFLKSEKQNRPSIQIETSIANGDIAVSPETNKLIVRFDRKMDTSAYGIADGKGKGVAPKIINDYWGEHDTYHEWVLELELEPNREYSLSFPLHWFKDYYGFSGKRGRVYLTFKTGV